MVVHAYILSNEVEEEGSEVQSLPWLHSKPKGQPGLNEILLLKKEGEKKRWEESNGQGRRENGRVEGREE